MSDGEERLHQLGAFEPMEAKRLLPVLEAHGIPFEIEADHSAMARTTHWMQLYFGVYPEGSKVLVFVRESDVARAMEALRSLFPV